MSAKDQIAQMLNELMGPSRNEDVNRSMLNFRDEDICKFFLAGFCPHDEFVNTKADLGPCQYIHDENLRIAYRNSDYFEKLGYERQFYRFLVRIFDDVQRKIERNKERLSLTQGQSIDETTKKQLTEREKQMEKEMSICILGAEEAGAAGQLEQSQKYVKMAEELKIELESVKKTLSNPQTLRVVNDPNAPKPMRVCDVCGCFLIIGDAQQRIEDHLGGKQHLGYAKITSTIEELRENLRNDQSPDRRKRSPDRDSGRHRDRKIEVESRHDKDDRDRNRHSKKTRSRSRDKHRHHRRSRSRSHDKKSKKDHR